jgi:hypothetical protein
MLYDLPTPTSSTGFSNVTTPSNDKKDAGGGDEAHPPLVDPPRPVLANISKTFNTSFVPNEWLALYQERPSLQDEEAVQLAFLQKVMEHFLPEGNCQTPAVPAIKAKICVPDGGMTPNFSPISLTPALRTQARSVHHRHSSSVRSILKTPFSSVGSSGTRTVIFAPEPTPCTRHGVTFFAHPGTPSTWPVYAEPPLGGMTPRTVGAPTRRDFFADLVPHHNRKSDRHLEIAQGTPDDLRKGWIPVTTPESFSMASSSEDGSIKTVGVKPAVADGGKENLLQPHTVPATETSKGNDTVMHSAHQSISSVTPNTIQKTLPRRPPLTGKKLEYKRSDSEKNIIASLD